VSAVAAAVGARLAEASESAGPAETGSHEEPPGEPMVTGATLRAQDVRPGDLFAGLPGARAHGADFAETALNAGAAAVLTDPDGAARPAVAQAIENGIPVLLHDSPRQALGAAAAMIYGEPSQTLSVLGITGTSGKTTTTHLIEAGLIAAGRVPGLIGTVETRVAGQRLPSAFTTPEAPDLQALLALMVEQGVTDVTMEVSSHALALGRVTGTRFAVGAFSNLSQDHLDFHRDVEDYFQAKALLFDGRSNTEVVCVDSEWGRRLVTEHTITVSTSGQDATWTLSDHRAEASGIQSFTAHGPEGAMVVLEIGLPGPFNVENALLATAVLYSAGVPLPAIAKGLSDVEVPGRMERVDLGQDFTAVVDYPHKPAAVAQMLDAVRDQLRTANSQGRIFIVLGCGGDRDTGKRPLMGEAAASRADLLVITDDNPRSEDPAAIRAEMMSGALSVSTDGRGEVLEIGDRRAAIAEAVRRTRAGDVVIVAGKGHERGQEVAGVVHPFSDTDELATAIRSHLGQEESGPQEPGNRAPGEVAAK
jgi:UDP-N-acetylmuramoyl-L-alanyl-D-glutamate--2,6-diaminopimelate ligase